MPSFIVRPVADLAEVPEVQPVQLRVVPEERAPPGPSIEMDRLGRGPPDHGPTLRCDACGLSRAPWRCPRGARCRGELTARHIAGIVPRVPVRHWWLGLPLLGVVAVRAGPELIAGLVRAFVRAVFGAYRRQAGIDGARCGAVSVATRVTPRLTPELRVHALVLDGVYRGRELWFEPAVGAPRVDDVAAALMHSCASIDGWGALAPRVGQALAEGPPLGSVRRVFGAAVEQPRRRRFSARCDQVLVRASEAIEAEDRGAVIELARYLARPVTDPRRFSPRPDRWVRYALPRPLSDGTRYVELSADALAGRLARLAGPTGPRVRYHGILASGRESRSRVLPEQLALVDGCQTTIAPAPVGRLPPYLLRARGGPEAERAQARVGSTAASRSVEGAK